MYVLRRILESSSASLILTGMFINVVAYQSHYDLFTTEILIALLGLVGLGLVSQQIFDRFRYGAAVLTAGLLFLFVDQVGDYSFWYEPVPWLLAILLVCFVLGKNLNLICGASFAVMTISTLILLAYESPEDEPYERKTYHSSTQANHARGKLPPLVHIVLDGHIGVDGLPTDIGASIQSKKAILEFYGQHEFDIYGRAYSRYGHTRASLATAFNFDGVSPPDDYLRQTVMTKNRYLEQMDQLGYAINVYQTEYLKICHDKQKFEARCTTYPAYDPRRTFS